MKHLKIPDDLSKYKKSLEAKHRPDTTRIFICTTGCRALGAEEVCKAFKDEITKQSLAGKIEMVETGCQGLCTRAPVLTIEPLGIFYGRATETDVPEIISRTIQKGEVIDRLESRRDRWGFSYYVFQADAAETMAPLVAELTGR